ncbi:helix-turn-helix transcriptional regulator [Pseudomonas frederiksbergensis]|uniref:helix-turn-helix transcriptional regulator n=1 Tax=Pseudomonas frederiksbergensis TaxID=104087 RepID=UPI000F4958EE
MARRASGADSLTGTHHASPQAYHRSLRLQKARSLLRQTNISVTEVSVCCGFSSSSDFSRAFKREFGQQPAADRKEIHYLERPSEQGAVVATHQLAN